VGGKSQRKKRHLYKVLKQEGKTVRGDLASKGRKPSQRGRFEANPGKNSGEISKAKSP